MVGICRLCAAVRKMDLLIQISDTNHDICHKLKQCCQVEIKLNDSLPKSVCRDCINALQQAYDFFVKVHESQESLSAFFAEKEPQENDVSSLASPQDGKFAPLSPRTKDNVSEQQEEPETIVEAEINDNEDDNEAEMQRKSIDEETHLTVALSEDEVDLILENDFKNELDDEVYLIEKILGKKCNENTGNCGVVEDNTKVPNRSENQNLAPLQLETTSSSSPKYLKDEEGETIMTIVDFQNDGDEVKVKSVVREQQPSALESNNRARDDEAESLETWNAYPWRCYLCAVEESSFSDLLLHFQVSHDLASCDDIQFKCVDCQKVCTRYYNFINHVRFHHRSSLLLCCDVCNKFSSDYKQHALHRREQHSLEYTEYPEVLICPECGRSFSTQNSLQIHSKIHLQSSEIFECSICGKKFKQSKGLKSHQKVHSGVKEFSCEQCGKSFRQKVNLEVHLLTHINDKPYECSICQKSFKTPASLEKHNGTHTDIKKFKCDYCDHLFRSKDSKLSHERTHTGEMPFKCQTCLRSFRFRGTFLAHINTHTGRRPYSCIPCNHHFTNWSNYNKHMKRRHADQYAANLAKRADNKKSKKTTTTEYEYSETLEEEVTDSSTAFADNGNVVYSVETCASESAEDGYGMIEICSNSEVNSEDL